MSFGRAPTIILARSGLLAMSAAGALLCGCDGPHAKAGKQADVAAGIKAGPLTKGPNERLGVVQDRAERDQARAVEDRAKEVRSAADTQADALERQAAETRKAAKQSAKALDQQANAIRGK
ncbi:hypothetical protein [Sphingomonas sp. TREG-RG-20F-R18-01]|uniref:hypothetical protein n=1 Tax=Sphingomonas sp. TREG-RG-20F-R18-01 TaxID=2914982 RepID=UPI001F591503|nr:hypothetical protein [Sphingomonas sp. TREG-RG-20F-R18-01]